MQVREGMSDVVLTIGPEHTVREAATAMCRRNVGAAVAAGPLCGRPGASDGWGVRAAGGARRAGGAQAEVFEHDARLFAWCAREGAVLGPYRAQRRTTTLAVAIWSGRGRWARETQN